MKASNYRPSCHTLHLKTLAHSLQVFRRIDHNEVTIFQTARIPDSSPIDAWQAAIPAIEYRFGMCVNIAVVDVFDIAVIPQVSTGIVGCRQAR